MNHIEKEPLRAVTALVMPLLLRFSDDNSWLTDSVSNVCQETGLRQLDHFRFLLLPHGFFETLAQKEVNLAQFEETAQEIVSAIRLDLPVRLGSLAVFPTKDYRSSGGSLYLGAWLHSDYQQTFVEIVRDFYRCFGIQPNDKYILPYVNFGTTCKMAVAQKAKTQLEPIWDEKVPLGIRFSPPEVVL